MKKETPFLTRRVCRASSNQIRTTRAASVNAHGGTGGGAYLGYDGRRFEFGHLENAVHFVEASSASAGGLVPVAEWIREQYPA